MEQVIYADVLIALNIIITFALLLTTARLLHLAPYRGRMLIASLVGGASSLIIFAPSLGLPLTMLVKLLFSLLLCSIAFKPPSVKALVRASLLLFGVSFAFAGATLFLSTVGSFVSYSNGYAYADVSFVSLVVSVAVFYILTSVFSRLTAGRISDEIACEVRLSSESASVRAQGIIDSGCTVSDPISGEMPIIIGKSDAEALLTHQLRSYFDGSDCERVMLLSAKTASGRTLLACMRCRAEIITENKTIIIDNCLLAVAREDIGRVIVPSALARRESGRKANATRH